MEREIVASIAAEFRRYKALAEAAMNQLSAEELSTSHSSGDNAVATIAWHIAGNLRSRFTDFLTADGEKPWRDREAEFLPRSASAAELSAHWESGWAALFGALDDLRDADLERSVTIRSVGLGVHEALHRSLAHASYHVGQIVYVSKMLRGEAWQYLSIPPGGSADYNRNPTSEKALDHVDRVGAK